MANPFVMEVRKKRHLYRLEFGLTETPRFAGDTICAGTRFELKCNGKEAGAIYFNSWASGQFTHSLNKLRWSGDAPNNHGAVYDATWHDGGPFWSIAECFFDAVERAERIYDWRRKQHIIEQAQTAPGRAS